MYRIKRPEMKARENTPSAIHLIWTNILLSSFWWQSMLSELLKKTCRKEFQSTFPNTYPVFWLYLTLPFQQQMSQTENEWHKMLSWPPNVNTAGSCTLIFLFLWLLFKETPSRRFLTAILCRLWLCATCVSINALFHSRRCDVLFTLLHAWLLLPCLNINDGWYTGYESTKTELKQLMKCTKRTRIITT